MPQKLGLESRSCCAEGLREKNAEARTREAGPTYAAGGQINSGGSSEPSSTGGCEPGGCEPRLEGMAKAAISTTAAVVAVSGCCFTHCQRRSQDASETSCIITPFLPYFSQTLSASENNPLASRGSRTAKSRGRTFSRNGNGRFTRSFL